MYRVKTEVSQKKEGSDMIHCITEDDGIGRQQSTSIRNALPGWEKSSLGMKITQSKIDILNKTRNTKGKGGLVVLYDGTEL